MDRKKKLIQEIRRFLEGELACPAESTAVILLRRYRDPFTLIRGRPSPVFLVEAEGRKPFVIKCFLDPRRAPQQFEKSIAATRLLEKQGFQTLACPELIAAWRAGPFAHFIAMSLAQGENFEDSLGRGDTKTAEKVAGALAELHQKKWLRQGEVYSYYKKMDAALLKQFYELAQDLPLPLPRILVRAQELSNHVYRFPENIGMIHGDCLPDHFIYDAVSDKVVAIDIALMHSSVDASGVPGALISRDYVWLTESMEKLRILAGRKSESLREVFAASYFRNFAFAAFPDQQLLYHQLLYTIDQVSRFIIVQESHPALVTESLQYYQDCCISFLVKFTEEASEN